MSLPNPGMSFTPFDPLPASDLNDLVENIESVSDGTGLEDNAITPDKRSGGFYAVFHAFGSGTGTKTITGLGFKPKALIVLGNGYQSTAAGAMTSGYAYDADTIVQGSQSFFYLESGSDIGSDNSTTSAFNTMASGGSTPDFLAAVTSFDSDGISVNVTTGNATGAYNSFHILFLG